MDFVPDHEVALKQITTGGWVFDTYSPAYIVTNEDLRETMQFMPKNCENALVVAASGDHPLFCSLYGAKHVDTFDISYNAKCIMDIKAAALKCLDYGEYRHLLDDLYVLNLPECRRNKVLHYGDDITKVPNMYQILYRLPKIESDYICALKNKPLFSNGSNPSNSSFLPNSLEYHEMQKSIKQSYDFILTDIYKLGDSLTKSYDFIHLSNIFDYIRSGHYEKIVLSLMEHVNPGGRIITQFFIEGHDEVFGFSMAEMIKNNKNWTCIKEKSHVTQATILRNGTYVLERVR